MNQKPITPEDEKRAAAAGQIIQNEKPFTTGTAVDLRVRRSQYHGLKTWPEDIRRDSPEGVVFSNLNICYKNMGNVCESLIGNILWGFRQSGIPSNVAYDGLKGLIAKGYMCLTASRTVP